VRYRQWLARRAAWIRFGRDEADNRGGKKTNNETRIKDMHRLPLSAAHSPFTIFEAKVSRASHIGIYDKQKIGRCYRMRQSHGKEVISDGISIGFETR
jgi:hypothetical protein